MPKHKRKHSDSEYNHIVKKLRKLERKLVRGRKRRHSDSESSSSDCDSISPRDVMESDSVAYDDNVKRRRYDDDAQPGCSYWDDQPVPELDEAGAQSDDCTPPFVNEPDNPVPLITADATAAAAAVPASTAAVPASTAAAVATTNTENPPAQPSLLTSAQDTAVTQVSFELDQASLEIIGDDPTSTKEYSDDIQKDLAVRLNHIATSGLSKEIRKEFKEKYLVPANCKSIKAPVLNPEIRAALKPDQIKKDTGIENRQVLNSCALSSLGTAITLLLSSEYKNPELLKLLWDAARILGDIQHGDSYLRRYFICSSIKDKEIKDQLEKTKIETMLFGDNLPETLKLAKIITKSGEDLRLASTAKPAAQKSSKAPNRPLNYRGPPARGRGAPASRGARSARGTHSAPAARQTRTTPPRHSDSRTSSRQPHSRHRH